MIVGGARWRWSLEEAGGAWRSWRGQIALLLIYGASLAGWPLFPRQCFFFRLLAGDEMAGCFFLGGLFFCLPLCQFRRLEKHVVGRPRFAPLCCGSDSSSGSFLASLANL